MEEVEATDEGVKFDDLFIITAYFTDTVKGGEILWEKK